MKQWLGIFVVVLVLVALGIGLLTQTAAHTYIITWSANTEPDMKEYRLYIWEGADTTQSPFEPGISGNSYQQHFVKTIPHQFGVDTITTTYDAIQNGEWIQAAVAAVDSAGNVSGVGVSNFLRKVDTTPPTPPKQVKVSEG